MNDCFVCMGGKDVVREKNALFLVDRWMPAVFVGYIVKSLVGWDGWMDGCGD